MKRFALVISLGLLLGGCATATPQSNHVHGHSHHSHSHSHNHGNIPDHHHHQGAPASFESTNSKAIPAYTSM